MNAKRILFITQEITPYLPETMMSKMGRYLPQGIQDLGREIRTFMPRYGNINERRNQLHEVIRLSGMNLIIDDADHPLILKVSSIQPARMQIYFIDNEDFFNRKATVCDLAGNEFADNDKRAIFYIRGVLETAKKLRWIPNLVHCHGWISAFAPIYMKRKYGNDPCFTNSKVVYSVYDNPFKQPMSAQLYNYLRQDGISDKDVQQLKTSTDYRAITTLAVRYSDGVIQGSPTISDEVMEIIEQENKPFLPYQTEDNYINAYNEFYDTIMSLPKIK